MVRLRGSSRSASEVRSFMAQSSLLESGPEIALRPIEMVSASIVDVLLDHYVPSFLVSRWPHAGSLVNRL